MLENPSEPLAAADFAGLDGLGGGSYIDDMVLRDRDVTGPATLEERVYYCQDSHHDVSALVDAGGTVLERVKYGPYGSPRVYPRIDADWDGSGKVTKDDLDAFAADWENADPRCDLNGDGDVSEKDLDLFNEAWGNGWTATDDLSIVAGNRFGYTGHLWDKQIRKYHARHRVYDAAKGRFLNRDPLEYAAGSVNLYEYVGGGPLEATDPLGLGKDETYPRSTWPDRPIAPRDGRPHAPYDINPWDTPDDIIRKQAPFLKRPPNPGTGNTSPLKEFGKGAWDGLLCTCEGAINQAIDMLDPPNPYIEMPNVRVPDSWLNDPNDPNLDTSRTMGKVSCVCVSTVAACRGAAAVGGTKAGNVLNRNRYFRIGPGRMPKNGPFPAGPKVPRISIGEGPGNPHIDLRIRWWD